MKFANYFKTIKTERWAIVFLLCFYIPFHILITPGYWDDAAFAGMVKWNIFDLFQHTANRYTLWSSRITIELLLPYIAFLPNVVWKSLNLFMVLLLYWDLKWLLENIFQVECKKHEIYLALLLCAFPFSIMAQTGWIATTMNYLWVIALGVYAINCMLKSVVLACRLSKKEIFFCSMAVLYSTSYESMAAILLIIEIGMIFCSVKKKQKMSGVIWISVGITVIMLLYILACPGNTRRVVEDAERWMPAYFDMTFGDKVRVGIVSTYMHFVSIPSPLFFMLNLCIVFLAGTENKKDKVISSFPLILDITWTCYFLLNYILGYKNFTYQVPSALLDSSRNIMEQGLMLATVLLWFVVTFYILIKYMPYSRSIGCICTLLLACIPEVAVGITPTVFASILRTTIYLYMAFIIVIVCVYQQIKISTSKFKYGFMMLCIIGGMVLNACQIIRHIALYG